MGRRMTIGFRVVGVAIVLGGAFLAGMALAGSPATKLCIPEAAGKAAITPSSQGICTKKHYTLAEFNPEGRQGSEGRQGPEGKAGPQGLQGARGEAGPEGRLGGATIFHQVHLAGITSIPNGQDDGEEVPLANASWTQSTNEAEEIIGDVTFTVPSTAECPERNRSGVSFQIHLDGVEDPEVSVGGYPGFIVEPEEQNMEAAHEETHQFRARRLLIQPDHEEEHTVQADASVECDGPATGDFAISSLRLDVIRIPEAGT